MVIKIQEIFKRFKERNSRKMIQSPKTKKEVINVNIEGKEYNIKNGETVLDVLGIEKCSKKLGIIYNGSVRSMEQKLTEDGEISFVNIDSEDGGYIYIRGLLYIFTMAMNRLYPEILVTVEYQLQNAMYIAIKKGKITEDMLVNVEKEMGKIVKQGLEINKKTFTMEEAEKFYNENGSLRGKMQYVSKSPKDVTLYFCEEFFGYFYGVMPKHTCVCNVFKIEKYQKGILLRYPDFSKDITKVGEFKQTKKLKRALDEYTEIYDKLGISTVYHLNKMVKENPKDLILWSEALHEKKIYELSEQILERKNVKMILIAGPSSSGKTTFAGKLSTALKIAGKKPVTISVDNYFVERKDTPLDDQGNYDFEDINAIDLELLNNHLERLLAGEEIEVPTFDFKDGTKRYLGNTMKIDENDILILEGIHCLNDMLTNKIENSLKFKIYISALTVLNIDYFNRISTTDTRLIRRIIRDFKTRHYSAEDTLNRWYSVRRGEKKNIFPYQEQADFMFNSSVIYEMAVLKKQIVPLLEEIQPDSKEYKTARRLLALLQYFEELRDDVVPNNSLIREFLGGSIYEI